MGNNDRLEYSRFYTISQEDQFVVCSNCLQDTNLISNLDGKFEKAICSFCNTLAETTEIEYLFVEIQDAIVAIGWVFALDEGSFCTEDGGYQHDTYELKDIAKTLCEGAGINNDDILELIYECFSDELIIDKPYGQDYLDEPYQNDWESFKKLAKHYKRFTCLMSHHTAIKRFKNLMQYISENSLMNLSSSCVLFRGRVFEHDNICTDPKFYLPPPVEYTKNSRMTPKGISCLYCSSNICTAISEIYRKNLKVVGVVRIRPKTEIKIIDFVGVNLPSPFDKSNRHYMKSIDFLKSFINEISTPITIDDQEHLEYIPTQIIFEYLSFEFKRQGISGIRYSSSKIPGGVNYAFFVNGKEFRKKFCIRPNKARIIPMDKM